jgi:methyl-accepting chemotaxis protein
MHAGRAEVTMGDDGRSVNTNRDEQAGERPAGDAGSTEAQRQGSEERDVVQQLGDNADTLRALADGLRQTQEDMARARSETERLAASVRAAREAMRRTQERIRRTAGRIPRIDDEMR